MRNRGLRSWLACLLRWRQKQHAESVAVTHDRARKQHAGFTAFLVTWNEYQVRPPPPLSLA